MNRFTTSTKRDLEQEPLHVVILAGTLGYREKSRGPSILQTHNNQSILDIQVATIRHTYPKAIISVTVGFQSDKIIRLKPDNVSIIENQLWEDLNTVEEIRLYLNSVNAHRILFIDGPVYFCNNAIQITSKPSIYYYTSDSEKEVGLRTEDGYVTHFSYGLEDKWSGIAYLEGRSLDIYRKICSRENNKLCMFETLNILLEKGITLAAITSTKTKIVRF